MDIKTADYIFILKFQFNNSFESPYNLSSPQLQLLYYDNNQLSIMLRNSIHNYHERMSNVENWSSLIVIRLMACLSTGALFSLHVFLPLQLLCTNFEQVPWSCWASCCGMASNSWDDKHPCLVSQILRMQLILCSRCGRQMHNKKDWPVGALCGVLLLDHLTHKCFKIHSHLLWFKPKCNQWLDKF